MARHVAAHNAGLRGAAVGIAISKLERRALDDPALRSGCMLGDPFVCCDPCWHRWTCARVMEHLRGERFWQELDRGDFGLLKQGWHANLELVEAVVARVATGAGAVQVLIWAVETEQSLDDVVAILQTLDLNTRRVPRFSWLSRSAPCGVA
jgi:hypothetical protein